MASVAFSPICEMAYETFCLTFAFGLSRAVVNAGRVCVVGGTLSSTDLLAPSLTSGFGSPRSAISAGIVDAAGAPRFPRIHAERFRSRQSDDVRNGTIEGIAALMLSSTRFDPS